MPAPPAAQGEWVVAQGCGRTCRMAARCPVASACMAACAHTLTALHGAGPHLQCVVVRINLLQRRAAAQLRRQPLQLVLRDQQLAQLAEVAQAGRQLGQRVVAQGQRLQLRRGQGQGPAAACFFSWHGAPECHAQQTSLPCAACGRQAVQARLRATMRVQQGGASGSVFIRERASQSAEELHLCHLPHPLGQPLNAVAIQHQHLHGGSQGRGGAASQRRSVEVGVTPGMPQRGLVCQTGPNRRAGRTLRLCSCSSPARLARRLLVSTTRCSEAGRLGGSRSMLFMEASSTRGEGICATSAGSSCGTGARESGWLACRGTPCGAAGGV